MDSVIKRRLQSTIIIHPFVKFVDGDAIYGTPYDVPTYLVHKMHNFVDTKGVQTTSSTQCYISEEYCAKLSTKDLIVYKGKNYNVKGFEIYPSLGKGGELAVLYL